MTNVFSYLIKLSKDTIIYGFSQASSAVITLLLLPIYARVLSISEFGVLDLIIALTALIPLISGLQSDSSVARYYYEVEGRDRRVLLFNGLIIRIPISLIVLLSALPLLSYLSQLLFETQIYSTSLLYGLMSGFLQTIFSYLLLLFRFQQAILKYNLLSIGRLFTSGLMSICFIFLLIMGVEGILLGYLLSDIVFTTIALLLQKRELVCSFNICFIRSLLFMVSYYPCYFIKLV
jgi:O-antigen/teichoic acid export membrane protein